MLVRSSHLRSAPGTGETEGKGLPEAWQRLPWGLRGKDGDLDGVKTGVYAGWD